MEPDSDDDVFRPVQIRSDDEDGDPVPSTTVSYASALLAHMMPDVPDDADDNAMDVGDVQEEEEEPPADLLAAVDEGATRPSGLVGSGSAGEAMDQDGELRSDRLMSMMLNLSRDSVPMICVSVAQQRSVVHVPRGYASPVFAHLVQRLHAGSEPQPDDAQWAAYLLRYMREYGLHKVPVARPASDETFRAYPERLRNLKVSADLLVREVPGSCVALQEDWTENPGLGRVRMWCSTERERPMWEVLTRLFRVLEPRPPFWTDAMMKAELRDDPGLLAMWNEINLNFQALSRQRPG